MEYQQLMISVGRVGGVHLKVRALRLILTKWKRVFKIEDYC
jgi:hypothetical protein